MAEWLSVSFSARQNKWAKLQKIMKGVGFEDGQCKNYCIFAPNLENASKAYFIEIQW